MTNKEILSRLYATIRPYRFRLLIAMVAMFFVAAMTGVQTYLVKDLLDKIFMERNIFFLNVLPLIVVLIFFLKSVFYYLYNFLLEKVGNPSSVICGL